MTEETKQAEPTAPTPAPTAPIDSFKTTQRWLSERAAKAAAPKPKPEPEAETPEPAPKAEEPKAESAKATKALAAKLAGKEPEAKPAKAATWDETATRALKRAGMRDEEVEEMQALAAEKPWLGSWLSQLQKVQAKQDADFAALKAGTREPTPGALRPQAHEQGDQPGSGQDADVIEQLTRKLGEELGDDNATLLRQAFQAQAQQIAELREQVGGYTRTVNEERAAAEIEVMVQRSRASLREEFPWIDDDARFEAVASEMAALRPDEITPEGVAASMRKAARIVFFDDVKADAKSVASKLDNQRKSRTSATSPGGAEMEDGPVLDEFEISLRTVQMQGAGEPPERITRWVQQQHERRRKANKQ